MKRTFGGELDFYGDEHSAGGGSKGGEGEPGKRPQSVKTHISTTYGWLNEKLTLQGFPGEYHCSLQSILNVYPCSEECLVSINPDRWNLLDCRNIFQRY